MSHIPSANKGEWSELYVLFKLFFDRSIKAADMYLQATEDEYVFLQILREDIQNRKYIYDLKQAGVVNIYNNSGSLINSVQTNELSDKTKKIFDEIKNAKNSSFTIAEAVSLMAKYDIQKIKANSSEKSDIIAIIQEKFVSQSKPIGFSIKSQVGGASSLLNASKQTNFVFKVNGLSTYDLDKVNQIEGSRKIRDRLTDILDSGGSLEFSHVDSPIFTRNLRKIDTILPNLLGYMLLDYYLGVGSSVESLSSLCGDKNLYDMSTADVSYKIKSFLRAIALGMVPSKEWNTYLAAYGGYIIVKEDGELVCYHLYNDDDFRDYLFNNTKFDTPSSSRHDFGLLYMSGEQLMLKLNLQIRFKQ